MEKLAEQIKSLELKLLHTNLREEPMIIDELLDDAFEEIGNNGQIHSRDQVVEWLLNKDNAQHWFLADFCLKPVSNDIVIAIYRAIKSNNKQNNMPDQTKTFLGGSIRSSVWQRQGNQWKMVFHQATQRV